MDLSPTAANNPFSKTSPVDIQKRFSLRVVLMSFSFILSIVCVLISYILINRTIKASIDDDIGETYEILFSKIDAESKNALNDLIDKFMYSINNRDFASFESCMFPNMVAESKKGVNLSDEDFMNFFAPVSSFYDTFTKWSLFITGINLVDDPNALEFMQQDNLLLSKAKLDCICTIYFDMTLESDNRIVTFPAEAEIIKTADGKWYLWYTYFDVRNYYRDSYTYTGSGIDDFARDYVPYEDEE